MVCRPGQKEETVKLFVIVIVLLVIGAGAEFALLWAWDRRGRDRGPR